MSFATVGASSSSATPYIPPEQIDYFARLKSQAREDIHAALELGIILTESGEEFAIEDYQLCLEALKQAPRESEHHEEVKQLLDQLQEKVPSQASASSATSSSSAASGGEVGESIEYYKQLVRETGKSFAISKLARLLVEAEEDFPEADYQQSLQWLEEMPTLPEQKAEVEKLTEELTARLEQKKTPLLVASSSAVSSSSEVKPELGEPFELPCSIGPKLGEHFEFLKREAKRHPKAAYLLALCYYNGWGTIQYKDKAKEILREEAQSYVEALISGDEGVSSAEEWFIIGRGFQSKSPYTKSVHTQAITCYKWAAANGHRKAMKSLAQAYHIGRIGTPEDDAEVAALWYGQLEDHEKLSVIYLENSSSRIRQEGLFYFMRRKDAASYAEAAKLFAQENPDYGTQEAINLVKNSTLTQAEKETFLIELKRVFPGAFSSGCVLQ